MHSNDEMVYLRDVVETLIYMTDEDSDGVEEVMQLPIIKTKEVKYFDEDEKVWKIGNVIMEQKNEPQAEIPEYAEWKEPFEKMTDCPWK